MRIDGNRKQKRNEDGNGVEMGWENKKAEVVEDGKIETKEDT